MGQPLYFRKDKKGLPITRSNIKATKKPSSAHIQIMNVILAPLPEAFFKPRFSGTNKRYFIEFNATTGQIIPGTLIESINTPEGSYAELFSNNVVTLPLGSNENSGFIADTPEDLADVPLTVSQDFLTNGYRRTVIAP